MQLTKKLKIAAALVVLVVGLGTGSDAQVKGTDTDAQVKATDTPACDPKVCSAAPGCFCNRTCILWFCWGNYYCQCHAS